MPAEVRLRPVENAYVLVDTMKLDWGPTLGKGQELLLGSGFPPERWSGCGKASQVTGRSQWSQRPLSLWAVASADWKVHRIQSKGRGQVPLRRALHGVRPRLSLA